MTHTETDADRRYSELTSSLQEILDGLVGKDNCELVYELDEVVGRRLRERSSKPSSDVPVDVLERLRRLEGWNTEQEQVIFALRKTVEMFLQPGDESIRCRSIAVIGDGVPGTEGTDGEGHEVRLHIGSLAAMDITDPEGVMAITFNDRSGDERMTLSMDDHGPSLYMSHEGNAGVHIGIVDAGPEGWHVGPFSHFAETREVEAS